jgi:predicted nucleic acid-binding protein
MTRYVLDACAMLAVLANEPGAETVEDIYEQAVESRVFIAMNKVNLLEVYYDLLRSLGKKSADEFLGDIKYMPIIINHEISDDILKEAGRLKVSYRISLADSIALAQASVSGATLITADHHEFDIIDEKEPISFCWIR